MDFRISDLPITVWSKEPFTIDEFIKKYTLPQIVKIHDSENKRFQAPGSINLQQPILLYKVYTCRKIHGRTLALDEQGQAIPAGPGLIIPESYPGWLAMVKNDGRTAGYFSTVGEVARAMVPMFLVQDSVVGLKATPAGMCRTVVTGGQVLKTVGPYEDLNRQNIMAASKRGVHPDFMMYLKCLTQHGETIYLPYGVKGHFYCIASSKNHTLNHVFLMSNLLKVTKTPTLVRIISGAKPPVALPFTNIIKLEEVRRETIILGCTLVDNEPILLEINANSEFSFVKATDERILQRSEVYRRMCQFCTVEGDRWRQQIRVAHHVVPKPTKNTRTKTLDKKPLAPPVPARTPTPKIPPESNNQRNVCKEVKPVLPTCELIDFLKYTYRGYIFPKKFWMFRKARKFELSDKIYENSKPPFDILKAYYTKYKGKKCLTVKVAASKESLMLKGPSHRKHEFQRRTNSDDGYVTSCIDDESIYHSIC
ncbi:uncharacterized protein LOC129231081 [Uloborus diversus]|uniref:uncharacterized protein LOC129231081 n=1 Tax=Uloborus diversus TaxID=327109 RepID=UPI00240A49B7|nr:uncharacterized protein LOC129231081 [Uloborus diversus]